MYNGNPITQLSRRFETDVDSARHYLSTSSGLHPAFIEDGLTAISEKERRAGAPLLGALFPFMIADGLTLSDESRRRLAAAWLALYAYISIVDFSLDSTGTLSPRSALSASGLLAWGVAVMSELTSHTDFHKDFITNVGSAFAGQYRDILFRTDANRDRTTSDIDKNRAIVAAVAAYSAAVREPDDHLIQATERLLRPFQFLDDLADVAEDIEEGNITALVTIVRNTHGPLSSALNTSALHSILITSPEFLRLLKTVQDGLLSALIILDHKRDHLLVWYFGHLKSQISSLIELVSAHQADRTIGEPEILRQIQEIHCHS